MRTFIQRLRVAARAFRESNPSLPTPGDTPMGFKFAGNPAMESGTFEPNETALVKTLLSKTDVFINVGANIGYYCCWALQREKAVVAFEPLAGNVRHLCRNIRANGWGSRIEIFPIALSDDCGIVEIFGTGTGASLLRGWAGAPANISVLVPASTLDKILAQRFAGRQCFVLIDVEGVEEAVLRGAQQLIARTPKPVWLVEIMVSEHQPTGFNSRLFETFELFWKSGYEAWTADQRPRLVPPEEVKAIAGGGPDTFNTHNFLFIEAGKKERFVGA
jgi:FkbM family methyltransferase